MKIFVTGTRGIPDIPGGVEKHCQQLYPEIVKQGHEVIVSRRSSYVDAPLVEWGGVKLVDCFAPRRKSFEAIVHTLLSVIKAWKSNVDILHIHAIGPALMVPVARLLGMKVVMTNHGPDYDRQKWGRMARKVLRLGERWGGKYSNDVIVISEVIRGIVRERCDRESNLIYNGVPRAVLSSSVGYLNHIGVEASKYILAVARIVPEKGLHDLIEAYEGCNADCKLVIVGDADHEDKYSQDIKERAKRNPKIVMTGYITGEPLVQLYSHAGLFVLPSYHEGLPIVLLEALSYGLNVLVSDIPANLEVSLAEEKYFRCGDVGDLKEKMVLALENAHDEVQRNEIMEAVQSKYAWNDIAKQTVRVYRRVLGDV